MRFGKTSAAMQVAKEKVIYFFLGLLLVILNTVGLALANEFSVYNEGYQFGGTIYLLFWIAPGYCLLYLLIYFIDRKSVV